MGPYVNFACLLQLPEPEVEGETLADQLKLSPITVEESLGLGLQGSEAPVIGNVHVTSAANLTPASVML